MEDPGDDDLFTVFRNRWVKLAAAAALAVPVLYLLGSLVYRLRGVLIPFSLAVVGAYILNPMVEWMQKKLRWSRTAVVVTLISALSVLAVGLLALGIYYTVATIQRVAASAQQAIQSHAAGENPDLWVRITDIVQELPGQLQGYVQEAVEALPEHIKAHFGEISASLLKVLAAIAWGVVRFALASFNFVVFFVVMAYLLVDLPAMERGVKRLLPARYKDDIVRVWRAIDRDLCGFFRGQVLVALGLSAIYTVGLFLCGIRFWLLIGVVAGMANIVPYLGIAIGLVPALLLALIPYVGLATPIGVVAVFVIGQTVEGFYLTPKIVGTNVGMNPVVIIMSILIFGELFGFLGMIFAVPLASVCRVLLGEGVRYYLRLQQPAAEPPVPHAPGPPDPAPAAPPPPAPAAAPPQGHEKAPQQPAPPEPVQEPPPRTTKKKSVKTKKAKARKKPKAKTATKRKAAPKP